MAKRKNRKDESKIPFGQQCYEITKGPQFNEDGKAFFEAKCCPFYKHCGGIEGHCSILDEVIYDQAKMCDINTIKDLED